MREKDIRPKDIFDEYLRLAKKDTKTFFENAELQEIPCPACGLKGKYSFKKNNFSYSKCEQCQTLYVNPRPSNESFENYYKNSPSSKYWATTFYKETIDARREKNLEA